MMISLAEKVAIVTGGSRGIGRAIAVQLATAGAKVVVNYRTQEAAAQEVVQAIRQNGGEALAVQADVSRSADAEQLIQTTLAHWGQIDILVNNAGVTADSFLLRMDEEAWDFIIDTNLKSVFNCCKAVLPTMLRRKRGGRIVTIGSVSGLIGVASQTNYSAAKAGLIGLSKALAREVGSRQITVNVVAPGLIETDLTADISAEAVVHVQNLAPLGRLGKASEVANLVLFLASEQASYITGEVIRVDGGLAM